MFKNSRDVKFIACKRFKQYINFLIRLLSSPLAQFIQKSDRRQFLLPDPESLNSLRLFPY
jgi:hypothetical protein